MPSGYDICLSAVNRQLTALNVELYEIGIYDRDADKMMKRRFNAEKIIQSIKYFRHQNVNGCDIYIRPAELSNYVFVDDLTVTDVMTMEKEGYGFAVCLESSPMNYQGWVNVGAMPSSTAHATKMARFLADTFNGDVHSSDWYHFGRLAGFTNRKPVHVDEQGRYPFVKIYSSSSIPCQQSDSLQQVAKDMLADEDRRAKSAARAMQEANKQTGPLPDPIAFYRSELEYHKQRWAVFNSSDADWNIVLAMIARGFDRSVIESAMYEVSESVAKRSQSRALQYVDKTLSNAFLAIGVKVNAKI